MRFGDVLRGLIDEQEIMQKDLADKLNLAPSTIGNYVADYREPDFETLKMIASYFKVSTDYLLNYQYEETKSHEEDHLLKIYRSLSPEYQALLLDESRVLLKHSKK